MNTSDQSSERQGHLRWLVGFSAAIIIALLVLVAVQWLRLSELEAQQRVGNDESRGSSVQSSPNRRISPEEALTDRREALDSETPQQRGERMFEELQTVVVNDPQVLSQLVGQLVEEAQSLRELERQRDGGLLSEEAVEAAKTDLMQRSEALAESLLTRRQFDRYREVRQSWRHGRVHPDRDSTD